MKKFYLGFVNRHVIFVSASFNFEETNKLLKQEVKELMPENYKNASLTIKEFTPEQFKKEYGISANGLFE